MKQFPAFPSVKQILLFQFHVFNKSPNFPIQMNTMHMLFSLLKQDGIILELVSENLGQNKLPRVSWNDFNNRTCIVELPIETLMGKKKLSSSRSALLTWVKCIFPKHASLISLISPLSYSLQHYHKLPLQIMHTCYGSRVGSL